MPKITAVGLATNITVVLGLGTNHWLKCNCILAYLLKIISLLYEFIFLQKKHSAFRMMKRYFSLDALQTLASIDFLFQISNLLESLAELQVDHYE